MQIICKIFVQILQFYGLGHLQTLNCNSLYI